MQIFDDKSTSELIRSVEGEVAKALAEIRCSKKDLEQAETRMRFILAIVHYLKAKI